MPLISVVFFTEGRGTAPAYEAIQHLLRQGQRKEFAKCWARISRLEAAGYELRRPEADYLRDGIYELRFAHKRVQFRILYFFHDQTAVLSQLIKKEGKVPDEYIDHAIAQKLEFQTNPNAHTLRLNQI